MILKQTVKVKTRKDVNEHYIKLGYDCSESYIQVEAEHLKSTYSEKIKFKCDYCGGIYEKIYKDLIRSRKENNKDCCNKSECKVKKHNETVLNKYGVNNVMEIKETKDKIKHTCLEKYGEESHLKNKTIKDKIRNTCIEKYGCDNPMKNMDVKNKTYNTNIYKYGVKSPLQNIDIFKKMENTNIDKYGVKNVFQDISVKEKSKQTMISKYGKPYYSMTSEYKIKINNTCMKKYGVSHVMKFKTFKDKCTANQLYTRSINGSIPSSKQQKYIHSLTGGVFNYAYDRLCMDIAFLEEKIYIEYNGGGHNLAVKLGAISDDDFKIKEIKRYKFLKSQGWKCIQIESKKDFILKEDDMIKVINDAKHLLLHENKNHVVINIPNDKSDTSLGELIKL